MAFANFKRVADRCSIDCDHCKRGVPGGERPRRPVTRPSTTVVRVSEHCICQWLCDECAAAYLAAENAGRAALNAEPSR